MHLVYWQVCAQVSSQEAITRADEVNTALREEWAKHLQALIGLANTNCPDPDWQMDVEKASLPSFPEHGSIRDYNFGKQPFARSHGVWCFLSRS